jgi:TPP-dependent pyruvate/acetoin dehydrogenase alpha subunit
MDIVKDGNEAFILEAGASYLRNDFSPGTAACHSRRRSPRLQTAQSKSKISLAFTGEGGTSEGDFHEALNLAAVWRLPVIFIIENNGYALSTPVSEQYACTTLADKGKGYGMEAVTINGNNILEVYDTVKECGNIAYGAKAILNRV